MELTTLVQSTFYLLPGRESKVGGGRWRSSSSVYFLPPAAQGEQVWGRRWRSGGSSTFYLLPGPNMNRLPFIVLKNGKTLNAVNWDFFWKKLSIAAAKIHWPCVFVKQTMCRHENRATADDAAATDGLIVKASNLDLHLPAELTRHRVVPAHDPFHPAQRHIRLRWTIVCYFPSSSSSS